MRQGRKVCARVEVVGTQWQSGRYRDGRQVSSDGANLPMFGVEPMTILYAGF